MTDYLRGQVVQNDGSSYICKADHTSGAGSEPGVGGSWTTYWDLLAAAGVGITDGDKGDVVVSSSGATWTVNSNAITDTKLRDSAALSVIGRSANSSGDPADIAAMVGSVWALSPVDILVNNAGWDVFGLFAKGDAKTWAKIIDVNYLGMLQCTHAALADVVGRVRELLSRARDLPVFREVAGDSATYFSGLSGQALAAAIERWLAAAHEAAPNHTAAPATALTWAQSADQLARVVVQGGWQAQWPAP